MYCPKCSQSQASEEMRFCSRCGFPLATVATLLQNNGKLPAVAGESRRKLSGRRLAKESGLLTLGCWIAALVATFLFDFGGPFETIAKLAAAMFFAIGIVGMLTFLYAFLFLRNRVDTAADSATLIAERNAPSSLPPHQEALSDWPGKAKTKEIVRPGSVTENTTQLLDQSERRG